MTERLIDAIASYNQWLWTEKWFDGYLLTHFYTPI